MLFWRGFIMNRLRELQKNFSAFVWGGHDAPVTGIVANGFDPEQRLAIYRNNTLLGLTEALRAVYPVIDKLVGEGFFNRLSQSFICNHPPQSGCLLTFGNQFPDFLDGYRPAAHLPYLADTARLEWLRHEVYFESVEPALSLAKLADIPPDRYGELELYLHSAVRLLISRYPVLRIWQSNQPDSSGENIVDFAEGGCCVLVYRTGWNVDTVTLDWRQYRFLMELMSGLSLAEAVEDILSEYPDFDVTTMLQLCLSKSLFKDYVLN